MEPLSERVICGFRVREFKTLDSTSSYLKRLAKTDGRHKDAAVALSQTAGRGRSGRSFFSPESGLYLSVLLKKGLEAETAELITPAAAVAVAEAIEETGSPRAGIKWVNDIYIGGKKVCGILTETGASQALDWAVIGIGVNIKAPEGGFPKEIAERAGAAFSNPDGTTRERLLENVLKNLDKRLSQLKTREFVPIYRERSILLGKSILLRSQGGETPAKVVDIDGGCRLVVRVGGVLRTVCSGEVSVIL